MTKFCTKQLTAKLVPEMLRRGYQRKDRCFYQIKNDLAFCVEVDFPGLAYATYYVLPLYMPMEVRHYTYGNRLSGLPALTRDASEQEVDGWCEALLDRLERTVFPFFDRVASPEKLARFASGRWRATSKHLFCPDEKLQRLLLFTYLYLQDGKKTARAAGELRALLDRKPLLSAVTREECENELNLVNGLSKQPLDAAKRYCEENIAHAVRVCFGAG